MKRLLTAVILVPIIVWVILAAPVWIFRAVLAITGLLAYYEFDHIASAYGIQRAEWPGMVAGLALLLVPEPAIVIVLVAIFAFALSIRVSNLRAFLPAAAAFVLGIIYVFGAWRSADGLRSINPHWLMLAMLLSWAGDTLAYYVGRAFGKHKMAPVISPAKSWEGAAGSVAGSLLAGALYAHFLIPNASLVIVFAVSLIGNIAGQIGDLCESALKRGAGVKDSGTLLPGHGGWLDRIDSSLFAVPVVYALLKFLPN